MNSEHVAVILHELAHATHQYPDEGWPWKGEDFVHQTAVMMEEAGEAVREANKIRETGQNTEALYTELAQTAAMCLRCMESIRKYKVKHEKNSD